jgi:hypothetical protein
VQIQYQGPLNAVSYQKITMKKRCLEELRLNHDLPD